MTEKDEVLDIDIDQLKKDFKTFAKMYADDRKCAKKKGE